MTGVCSARHVEQARTLGAEHVIDYTREDFTRDGRRYDLILVVNGRHSLAEYRRALSPCGRLVVAGGAVTTIMQALFLVPVVSLVHRVTVRNLLALPSRDDLMSVSCWTVGRLVPVVDRCYPQRVDVEGKLHDTNSWSSRAGAKKRGSVMCAARKLPSSSTGMVMATSALSRRCGTSRSRSGSAGRSAGTRCRITTG